MTVGVVMILAAIVQSSRRDGFAAALALYGTFLVAYGAPLHRLRRAGVSEGGFGLELDPAGETAALANRDAPAEVAERMEQLAGGLAEAGEVTVAARVLLAETLLPHLLRPQEGPLAGCHLAVYLYNADSELLEAVELPGATGPAERWRVGQGATGAAYERGEYVLVEGEAVSDLTYGLSPEQQERFSDLTAVAAMPVTNASGAVIGVLTASSSDGQHQLATQEAFDQHLAIAEMVGRLLIDVLKWFDDD